MIDRGALEHLPYPWHLLPPEDTPLTHAAFADLLTTLLEQCSGLAAVCHVASQRDELAAHDMMQALGILSNALHSTLALVVRWKGEHHGHAE